MSFLSRDFRLAFGVLPVPLLERSTLSPPARLLFGVLDSFGERIFPAQDLIAFRLGLSPKNTKSVRVYLAELNEAGFLIVTPNKGGNNDYKLTMPEYCFSGTEAAARIALEGPGGRLASVYSAGGQRRRITAPAAVLDRLAWIAARRAAWAGAAGQAAGQAAGHQGTTVPPLRDAGTGHQGTTVPTKGETKGEAKEGDKSAPNSLRTKQAEKHWDQWPGIYQQSTGKQWYWNKKDIAATWDIEKILLERGAKEHRPLIMWNFAESKYWSTKGCPLSKLAENFNEFQPSKIEIEKAANTRRPKALPAAYIMTAEDIAATIALEDRQARAAAARAAGATSKAIQKILIGV